MTADRSWTDKDAIGFHAAARGGHQACLDLRNGDAITYAELDRLVSRAATWLRARLATPAGARVATLLRNGVEAVVLFYACGRIGAIYTPLNWRLAPAEIAALRDDCEAGLLVYEAEFAALAAEFAGAARFAIGPNGADFRSEVLASEPARPKPAAADMPAVILYTSGTTGRPKGVVLSRAALFWGAFNFAAVARVTGQSVMLCEAPMFHTVGLVATCHCILQQGGTLILSDRFVPELALQRLADETLGVTHFFGVPQIAQMLCDDATYDGAKLSRLQGLFVGGAPLPLPLCQRLLDDGVLVVNGYGMTETSTIVGMPLNAAAIRARPGAAGLPAPAIDLRIVSEEGRDLAEDEVGEIWVRGPGLASGYWGQPEATAAVFRDGWFRTGDAGRLDTAGYLSIVDRWKDMYISGGENVYPAEVEAAIACLEGVKEVGVVGTPNERWGEVGCAFVVAAPHVTEAQIAAHCAGRLARFKQPAVIHFVEGLPRTASGKLKKDDLRRMVDA